MTRDLRQTWWSFEVLSRSMPWAVEHWAVLPASPPNAFGHNRRRRSGRTDHAVNQQRHHWPPQPVVSKEWKGVRLLKKVHFLTRWLNTVWEEICLFNYDSPSRYGNFAWTKRILWSWQHSDSAMRVYHAPIQLHGGLEEIWETSFIIFSDLSDLCENRSIRRKTTSPCLPNQPRCCPSEMHYHPPNWFLSLRAGHTLSVRNLCHIAGVCAGINGKRVHNVNFTW